MAFQDDNSTQTTPTKYEYDYTTVGVTSDTRDELRELRDEFEYHRYEELIRDLIHNAQEDFSK
jgi:hypothetical protein